MPYFKRYWEESTSDPLTDSWDHLPVILKPMRMVKFLRQVQLFENGKKLKYDQVKVDDEMGGLSDVDLDLDAFAEFKIGQLEFEEI